MINQTILDYIFLFAILEFYEISWQKAPNIMGMIIKMYKYYSKNILIFLIMQPTFYFAIGFVILTNYEFGAMLLLFLKTTDIITKILLIEQVFVKKTLSKELSLILLAPINKFLPYIGLLVYPPLIIISIN